MPQRFPITLLFMLIGGLTACAETTSALDRWREHFSSLQNTPPEIAHRLPTLNSPVRDEILDTATAGTLRTLLPVMDAFAMRPDDVLAFPPIHGPETPFPDHAPLNQVARLRMALIKLAWNDGQTDRALALAKQNLDLASAMLEAQQGIIPVIASVGTWQTALDGVYWLSRQPGLTPAQAALLQARLANDDSLAARALTRAFEGEYTFIQKVVIERLPVTNDPELLLSSIGSLGMAPPSAPPEGEPRLPVAEQPPLDATATLALSRARAHDYTQAFAAKPLRHPGQIWNEQHLPAHRRLAQELGAFLSYAVEDLLATPERIAAANAVLATVDNPVGKLYVLIATPHWNSVSETVYRRQAQSNALQVLLAWRRLGRAADIATLRDAGLLDSTPADPFSDGPLLIDPQHARVWSVGPDGVDQGGEGDGENLGRPDDLAWPSVL
ncbi:MAG: hypothetical protein ABII82_03990 [Verrucomicrobiota bacterium]